MTTNYEKIKKQVDILCSTIKAKKGGNLDEHDVQRELGILYYLWQQEVIIVTGKQIGRAHV